VESVWPLAQEDPATWSKQGEVYGKNQQPIPKQA
jgi:hypothetical protein